MKTALIHYWLVNDRGGEKVLAELARLFPAADLLTHVYDTVSVPEVIRNRNIRTTFIQKLPFVGKCYKNYLPLMPLALRYLDLSGYDLIISSESGPAKGICKPPGVVHICYCHTPMRYLWDMETDYAHNASLLQRAGLKLLGPALRKWDLWSATQVDLFVANSQFVAERIKRIYNREAEVIYPPVDIENFAGIKRDPKDFYLFFGQLTGYKRADLAIEAMAKLGRKLIVAGSGEQLVELQKVATRHLPPGSQNIEFLGRISDDQRDELYAQSKALIFPGVEDFGIIPVEAQAAGCPVIALGQGGALESVVENQTGVFFREACVESLMDAVIRFESLSFDAATCRNHAKQFSVDRFRAEILRVYSNAIC